jgi:DNA-binding NarL/FixJ family response regulator
MPDSTVRTALSNTKREANDMIRLLLVDDEAAIRKGLRMQLELESDLQVIGEATNGRDALGLVREMAPDVVLMDVRMSVMDGLTATESLRASHPSLAVIVLSLFDDAATRVRALNAGARGFVGKHEPAERLLAAIRRAAPAPGFAAP